MIQKKLLISLLTITLIISLMLFSSVSGDTIIFHVGVGPNPVLLAFNLGTKTPETVITSTLPQGGSGKEFAQ